MERKSTMLYVRNVDKNKFKVCVMIKNKIETII